MDEQLLEQIKELFRESYEIIYNGGKFDALADQAEADGDVVPAVSLLVSSIINSTIKSAGVTDLGVLFGLAIMLIADLLGALEEVGITAESETVMADIINKTMQQVLIENPTIADEVAKNPEIQDAIAQAGGVTGGGQAAPQGGAPAQVPEGVL